MYDDEEEDDKVKKIILPKYQILHYDIDPKKLVQIVECIINYIIVKMPF